MQKLRTPGAAGKYPEDIDIGDLPVKIRTDPEYINSNEARPMMIASLVSMVPHTQRFEYLLKKLMDENAEVRSIVEKNKDNTSSAVDSKILTDELIKMKIREMALEMTGRVIDSMAIDLGLAKTATK